MFTAYPQQPRYGCWKLILPLLLAGVICLVLYISVESSEEESGAEPGDEHGLKRMHPFVSSQSFEIGLWTRSKASDSSMRKPKPTPPPLPTEPPELLRLRLQLERERARSVEKDTEIAQLRGAAEAAARQSSSASDVHQSRSVFDEAPHQETVTAERGELTTPEPIPESLFRGPPQQEPMSSMAVASAAAAKVPSAVGSGEAARPGQPAPAPAPPAAAPAPSTMPSAASVGSAVAPKKKDHGESTITVKAGGQDITLRISHEHDAKDDTVSTAETVTTVAPLAPSASKQQLPAKASNSSNLQEWVAQKNLLNTTEGQSETAKSSASKEARQSEVAKPAASKEATQIMVRSGQQTFTIEVRGSDEVEPPAPSASSGVSLDTARNSTTFSPTAPAPETVVHVPPDLPDYVAPSPPQAPAFKEGSQDLNSQQSSVHSTEDAGEEGNANAGAPSPAAPNQPAASAVKSSYANLALRVR
eukprot:TRINITY_DN45107_c0_g1_i1.p1 TRINITY_DN45107_c0_g1~~TRINITY_DN45107_c0_g1_i1.p1  ORF type:complete len:474 (-),score=98.47 TRINITY_DN45107_c0_g1_i1:187-1608(-)